MEKAIRIRIGDRTFEARLNNQIAGMIWEAPSLAAAFNFWGDEIYFPVPVHQKITGISKRGGGRRGGLLARRFLFLYLLRVDPRQQPGKNQTGQSGRGDRPGGGL